MNSNSNGVVDDDSIQRESETRQRLVNLAVCFNYINTVPLAKYRNICLLGNDCKPTIKRTPSLFVQRLNWDTFYNQHGLRRDFHRHIRMSPESFNKLVDCLREDLTVDEEQASFRGGAILPKICVYTCLRYLAGGSYTDIKFLTGISVSSFYRVLWKTITAINNSTNS
jgi:hypothetical protein